MHKSCGARPCACPIHVPTCPEPLPRRLCPPGLRAVCPDVPWLMATDAVFAADSGGLARYAIIGRQCRGPAGVVAGHSTARQRSICTAGRTSPDGSHHHVAPASAGTLIGWSTVTLRRYLGREEGAIRAGLRSSCSAPGS